MMTVSTRELYRLKTIQAVKAPPLWFSSLKTLGGHSVAISFALV